MEVNAGPGEHALRRGLHALCAWMNCLGLHRSKSRAAAAALHFFPHNSARSSSLPTILGVYSCQLTRLLISTVCPRPLASGESSWDRSASFPTNLPFGQRKPLHLPVKATSVLCFIQPIPRRCKSVFALQIVIAFRFIPSVPVRIGDTHRVLRLQMLSF